MNTSSTPDPTGATLVEHTSPTSSDSEERFLQPQTLGSIIYNTVTIYIRNWRTIALIYVLPLLPIAMLRVIFSAYGDIVLVLILFLVQILGSILIGTALTVTVSDICLGLKPNFRRSYRRGFRPAGC